MPAIKSLIHGAIFGFVFGIGVNFIYYIGSTGTDHGALDHLSWSMIGIISGFWAIFWMLVRMGWFWDTLDYADGIGVLIEVLWLLLQFVCEFFNGL